MSATSPFRQDLPPPAPLPPTLSTVLAGLRATGLRRLPALLQGVLEQADDALFDFAQRSGSSLEQQQFFDAMREVRRERRAIERRFADAIDDTFGHPDEGGTAGGRAAQLSLVDADSLEEQLACEQLATAAGKRQRELLHQIDSRLRLAIGAGPGTFGLAPPWARQVADAFRGALGPLELTIRARLVLYKLFERGLIPAYADLLDAFDRQLQQAGLAIARPIATPARPRPRPATAARAAATADAGIESAPSASRADSDPTSDAAANGVIGTAPARRSVEIDEELYVVMREALAAHWRQHPSRSDGGRTSSTGSRPLPRHSALDALSRLQAEPPRAILDALDDPHAALGEILGRELMRQAQGLGLADGNATLQEQDAQALALVGMLFDVLLTQRSYHRDVRRQFLRLSVPYAKAAMLDPRMFALKSHPARRLLDTLTEAGDGNLGESIAERDLLSKVGDVVDRLLAGFNEDVAIFAELDAEIRQFLEQYQRRIELAEKRAAEAQRGRERLDQARQRAAAELTRLIDGRDLADGPLARFLRDPWTHHLAIVELRDGSDSERYRAALDAGRTLAAARGWTNPDMDALDALKPVLGDVLASSGVQGGNAAATLDRLFADLREASAPGAGAQIVFHAQAGVSEVGVRDDDAAEPCADHAELPPAAMDDANAADHDQLARVRELAVGDWVEFVADDGNAVPAKLSWISPISSRLLFVNRRGVRHCVASLDELAAMLADGRLLLRSDESAFGRAMLQVLGRLRQPEPPSVPRGVRCN